MVVAGRIALRLFHAPGAVAVPWQGAVPNVGQLVVACRGGCRVPRDTCLAAKCSGGPAWFCTRGPSFKASSLPAGRLRFFCGVLGRQAGQHAGGCSSHAPVGRRQVMKQPVKYIAHESNISHDSCTIMGDKSTYKKRRHTVSGNHHTSIKQPPTSHRQPSSDVHKQLVRKRTIACSYLRSGATNLLFEDVS